MLVKNVNVEIHIFVKLDWFGFRIFMSLHWILLKLGRFPIFKMVNGSMDFSFCWHGKYKNYDIIKLHANGVKRCMIIFGSRFAELQRLVIAPETF